MSYSVRDLERLYNELLYSRDEVLAIIDDPRSTDLEYNRARSEIKGIESELLNVEDELKYQESLTSQVRGGYREPARGAPRGGSSLASNAFGNSRKTAMGQVDDLGSVRIKNQSNAPKQPMGGSREYVTRDSVSNSRDTRSNTPSFKTKVREQVNVEYSVSSLYPYVLSENVTTREEVRNKFKERVLQGISKDDTTINVNEIETVDGEAIDIVKYLSGKESCNYLVTCNTLYLTDINNSADGSFKIGDLLLNGGSLERNFGLPGKLTPIVNTIVCSMLNDALVLNNSEVIIKDMFDFKELLEKFTNVETTILKEIKNTVNNIEVVIDGNDISVDVCNPIIYGFPALEKHLDNSEAMFISEDSSPKVFEALATVSKACESNVLDLTTSTGSKYRIVISTIHKKAVIRKNNFM